MGRVGAGRVNFVVFNGEVAGFLGLLAGVDATSAMTAHNAAISAIARRIGEW